MDRLRRIAAVLFAKALMQPEHVVCGDLLERPAMPFREVPFDHSLVAAPSALVRLGVFLDVDFSEVAKRCDVPLGDFLLRRVPPLCDRGLQSERRLAGNGDVERGIGTDRDASHATVDASFVDEGFRTGHGDAEREAPQFAVAEELLTRCLEESVGRRSIW